MARVIGLMALIIALACAVGPQAGAQQGALSSKASSYLLKEVTTRIDLRSSSGHGDLCHGFVYTVRGESAYIATAKHCITDLAAVPLDQAASFSRLGIAATVEYPNGAVGAVQHIAWAMDQDVLIMVAPFTVRPRSYTEVCVDCRSYEAFGLGKQVPVVSVLSAGGGPPVISSGLVSSDLAGRYVVYLPASAGTSGAPVLDLHGNLVGIIATGAVFRGADASWQAQIVLGAAVETLARHALDQFPSAVSPPAGAFLITPGKSIGRLRLGMRIDDARTMLGAPAVTERSPDGSVSYRWRMPPPPGDLAVSVSTTATLNRIWTVNDVRYRTLQGLHAGSAEGEVRAALGDPSHVAVGADGSEKRLQYRGLGMELIVQLNPRYAFFRTVFAIAVTRAQ